MAGLKALDHVAYIRFASIYKDFSEPGDFAEIAERVEKEAIRRPATTSCCERRRQPVIVLVRPQLGQNIGKAARAMLNFGLTEMRLVAPARRLAQPRRGPGGERRGCRPGTGPGLRRRSPEAIADCSLVFASTVRRRDLVMPVVGPEEMAERDQRDRRARRAILFGPERSGLETEDVALASRS